jgi:replicative DNA helicase
VFDLRDQVKELYDFMLQETTKGKQIVHVAEVVNAERENYNLKAENYAKGLPTGVRTGLAGLDRILGGFQNSDLVILAARPAMGKTALVLTFAKNCNVPSVFFSLEMSSLQLTQRLIMQHAQVDAERYKNGMLSQVELLEVEKARGKVERMQLFIEDKAGIDWQELRSKALKEVERGAKIIFVDYLQLVNVPSAKNRNREAVISEISRELKKVAKDCNVPVIALSQLSRAVEGRGDKIPQLSDLRESGAIEQDADVVMFIHRPEYYGIMQDEGGNSTQGKAEVIIAKHRNGAVGTITTNFISSCTLFTDDDVSQPQSQQMYNPNTDAIKKYHDENPF